MTGTHVGQNALLALLILTVLAQQVADERSGGLPYVGSVFEEEVASFDRDEARSGIRAPLRHPPRTGQTVVGGVNEKGRHPDVFEWERVGGRLGHDGVERPPTSSVRQGRVRCGWPRSWGPGWHPILWGRP